MTKFKFRFRERKAAQAAAEFLKRAGNRENYTKLIKLLYLLERFSLIRRGHPVFGDRLVSMPKGPVVSNVYDLISTAPDPDDPSIWHQFIATEGFDVRLAKDPGQDELSDAEIAIIDELFNQHRHRTFGQMIDFCHTSANVPEWKDPSGSSSDIWPEDLMKIGGWNDEDIDEDAAEINHLEQMRASLR